MSIQQRRGAGSVQDVPVEMGRFVETLEGDIFPMWKFERFAFEQHVNDRGNPTAKIDLVGYVARNNKGPRSHVIATGNTREDVMRQAGWTQPRVDQRINRAAEIVSDTIMKYSDFVQELIDNWAPLSEDGMYTFEDGTQWAASLEALDERRDLLRPTEALQAIAGLPDDLQSSAKEIAQRALGGLWDRTERGLQSARRTGEMTQATAGRGSSPSARAQQQEREDDRKVSDRQTVS